MVGKTGNGAALLVNPQKQRDFCRLLQKSIVGGNLLRAVKVGGELDDSPHRVFCKNLPDGIFHLGKLLLGQGLHGGFDLGKAQSARGHHEQLPYLFFQGHGLQLQNQGVRLCGGFRGLGGGLGCGFCFPGLRLGGFRGRGQGNTAREQGEGEQQSGESKQFFHGSASFGENVNKGQPQAGQSFVKLQVFPGKWGKTLTPDGKNGIFRERYMGRLGESRPFFWGKESKIWQ